MRIHFDCYFCGLGIIADFDDWVTLDHFANCPNCHSDLTVAEKYDGELPKSIEELVKTVESEDWTVDSVQVINHGVVRETWNS